MVSDTGPIRHVRGNRLNNPVLERRSLSASASAPLCLDTFWEINQTIGGIVHRQAFTAALGGVPFSLFQQQPETMQAQFLALYGYKKPSALLFAILANGAVYLEPSWGYTETEKLRIARSFMGQAVSLLLFSGSGSSSPATMTDFEAVQTVIILYDVVVPAGLAGKAASLLSWGARLLKKICLDGPNGTGPLDNPNPAHSLSDWIYRDTILRYYWSMAALDLDIAYYNHRDTFYNYFGRPRRVNLPWHEIYFFDDDPMKAWKTMQVNGHGVPSGADLTRFAREPNAEMAMLTSRMFVEPAFSFRAGFFTVLVANCFIVGLTERLRRFAEKRGVKALEVLAKSGSGAVLSAKEAYFMERVHLADYFILGCFHAIPGDIGKKMLEGDADAFFRSAPNYFADVARAHFLFGTLLIVLSKMIQNRFHGAGNPDPLALFMSPEFGKVLETATVFTAMLRAQLKDNPELDGVSHIAGAAVLRIFYASNCVAGGVTPRSTGAIAVGKGLGNRGSIRACSDSARGCGVAAGCGQFRQCGFFCRCCFAGSAGEDEQIDGTC